jgi:LemA protein
MQIQVNQASSNIDVQLKQRRDTLVKLVDVTKSSVKFEKNLLTDVTKLRSIKNFNPIAPSNTTNLNKLESLNTKIMATLENYPKLESVKTIRELMNSADYLEREIAATRRTYNATVTSFNQALYV